MGTKDAVTAPRQCSPRPCSTPHQCTTPLSSQSVSSVVAPSAQSEPRCDTLPRAATSLATSRPHTTASRSAAGCFHTVFKPRQRPCRPWIGASLFRGLDFQCQHPITVTASEHDCAVRIPRASRFRGKDPQCYVPSDVQTPLCPDVKIEKVLNRWLSCMDKLVSCYCSVRDVDLSRDSLPVEALILILVASRS